MGEHIEASVVVIGTMVADRFGERDDSGVFVTRRRAAGGDAVNVAIALTRLGHRAAVVSCVGDDDDGRFLRQHLEREGIITDGVTVRADAETSHSDIVTGQGGDFDLEFHPGANRRLTMGDVNLDAWDARLVHYASYFTLDALDGEPAAEILEEARRRGMWTSLDNGWDAGGRWLQLLAPVLPSADFHFPNLAEARALTGRADPAAITQFLLEQGAGDVALKAGRDGCYLRTAHEFRHIPAFPVQAVNSVGAGDAFAAGFLAGLLEGQPLAACARMGCAAGALACQAEGAHEGFRSRAQLDDLLARSPTLPDGA